MDTGGGEAVSLLSFDREEKGALLGIFLTRLSPCFTDRIKGTPRSPCPTGFFVASASRLTSMNVEGGRNKW